MTELQDRLMRIATRARDQNCHEPSIRHDIEAVGRQRLLSITFRAAAQSVEHDGSASQMMGTSIQDMMQRVIASGFPCAIRILSQAPLQQIHQEYEALSPIDRREELERHLWSAEGIGRPRTYFSDLLDMMGVGR